MGSSYYGDLSLGNGRSGSSRKGKKSNSEKPKQPQRGLGVAQLEQIRLRNQMGSCYLPSLHSSPYTNLNQVFIFFFSFVGCWFRVFVGFLTWVISL